MEGSIGVGSSVGFPDVVSSGGSTGCVLVDVMITTVVLVVPSSVDVIVVTVVDVGVVVVSVVEVSSSEEVVDVDEVVDVVVDSGVLSGSEDVDDDVVVEGTVVNVVDGGSEVAVDDGSVDGGGEGGSVDGSSGVVVGGWGSGSGSGVSSGGGADVGSSDTLVDMLEVCDGADVRLADVVGRADGEAADVDGPTTIQRVPQVGERQDRDKNHRHTLVVRQPSGQDKSNSIVVVGSVCGLKWREVLHV